MATTGNILNSYLVSLGFVVNNNQYRQFTQAIQSAGNVVSITTNNVVKDIIKWQTAIVAAFTAVSGAVIGTADAVAQADQEYRLFGLRMMVTTDNARKLKIALDALGQPLEVIALDPELHARFMELYGPGGFIDQLTEKLGPDFEAHMLRLRDLRFEVTKLGTAFKFLSMEVVDKLFIALEPQIEWLIKKFQEWSQYIIDHMPEIAESFSKFLLPILKDTWEIFKAIGEATKEFTILFTNLIALFSGDDTLKTTTLDFEKLAYAISLVAHFLRDIVLVGADSAKALSLILNGKFSEANAILANPKYFKKESAFASGASPTPLASPEAQPSSSGASSASPVGTAGMSKMQQAAALALMVGRKTGVDPRMIFEQWANESNGFTSSVFNRLNNAGGIRYPGTTVYEKYGSFEEFANRYAQVISSKRYKGLANAHTEQDFSSVLKRGGYFESTQPAYANRMKDFSGAYTDASTHINKIEVNVGGTNATAHDIASAMGKEFDRRNQLNVAQLSPGAY